MMKVPSPECWRGFVEVAGVDDEGSFSKMLEKVLSMLSMLMTKAPSPKCWTGFVEVAEVNDEGSFSRMLEKVR